MIPVHKVKNRKPTEFKLFAVNNTYIDTYGETRLTLNFKLRRTFCWNFCVAAVPYPIIKADFFKCYGLLVDLRRARLIDPVTNLFVTGVVRNSAIGIKISVLDNTSQYHEILSQFLEITGQMQNKVQSRCDIFHYISVTGSPVAERAKRLAPNKLKIVRDEFRYLIEQGVCRPSCSPWASPIHFVPKKNGSYRICSDYRRLNALTVPDKYPLPHLHDFSFNLCGKSMFTKIDLFKAYYQVPVAPEDVPKTAMITPFGLFEYLVMPFGLRNAGQTFQRFLNRIFVDLDYVFIYLDDILVASSSVQEHQTHLHIVCQRLKDYSLHINPSKCEFGKVWLSLLFSVIILMVKDPNLPLIE